MRKIILLFAGLLLTLSATSAGATDLPVTTVTMEQKMYVKPDESSKRKATLFPEENLFVLDNTIGNGWIKVQRRHGTIGYIQSDSHTFPGGLLWTGDDILSGQTASDGITALDGDGHPVGIITKPADMHDTPERTNTCCTFLAAGSMVTVLDPDVREHVAEILVNGEKRYISTDFLEMDSRKFSQYKTEHKPLTMYPQRVFPKGGTYRVRYKDNIIRTSLESYGKAIDEALEQGQLISGVRQYNREYSIIPYKDSTAYIETSELRKLYVYQIADIFGPDSEEVADELALLAETPDYKLFNGWKAGLMGVWIIIVLAIATGILELWSALKTEIIEKRWFRNTLGLLLVLLGASELWYFLSLGFEDVAWFLGERGGDAALWNFIMMLAVTAVHGFGIFAYLGALGEKLNFECPQVPTIIGIFISLIMYGMYAFLCFVGSGYTEPEVVVLCAAAGQIIEILAIPISYIRQVKTGRKIIFIPLIVYWISITGFVCMSAISIGLLIAMIVGVFLLMGLVKTAPSSMYQAAQSSLKGMSETEKYNAKINIYRDQARHGTLDPDEAQRRIRNLESDRDNGKPFDPENN